MTTDTDLLIARLHDHFETKCGDAHFSCGEAADEIERLRAALEQIAMIQHVRTAEQTADYFQHVAREALRAAVP